MFEQATLTNAPAGRRAWSAFLGLTTQAAVVSFAVLLPMVWPQVLPTAKIFETLVPPAPPGPRQLGETKRTTSRRVARHVPWAGLRSPGSVPKGVHRIVDEPVEIEDAGPAVGANAGPYIGPVGAGGDNLARNFFNVEVPKPPVVAVPKPPDPVAVIRRYKEGGRVVLGAPLRRVEPPYPLIAKTARVSGVVELECVVGADGRIKEVKVVSGSPLLVRAAVDAAWQWIYGPSKLNGDPIEIITRLTFNFKLN